MELKGQSAIELIAVITFITFVFIILTLAYHQRIVQSNDLEMFLDTERILNSIAGNINTIVEQGSNYYLYFSIPSRVRGGHSYNVSINNNVVTIFWYRHARSSQLMTSNISFHCLDYGEDLQNKVLNQDGRIIITCNRADLRPLSDTFWPRNASPSQEVEARIDIINEGVLDSGEFIVLFNSTSLNVSQLRRDEKITLRKNITMSTIPGNYTVEIILDSGNQINESIESDNRYNGTIQVG